MKLSDIYRRLEEYVLKNDKENKKWFDFYRDRKFYGAVVEIGTVLLQELRDAANEEGIEAAIKKAFNRSTQLHIDALYYNDRKVCNPVMPIKTNIPDEYFKGVSEKDFRAVIEKGYGISFQMLLHTIVSDIKNLEFDALGSKTSKELKDAIGLTILSTNPGG